MLTRLLETLDFRSNNDRHRPVMEALALIRKHVDSRLSTYPSDEIVPLDEIVPEIVPETWRDIVIERAEDGTHRFTRVAYEICVLEALRDRLRIKEVWVQGAQLTAIPIRISSVITPIRPLMITKNPANGLARQTPS